MKNENIIIALIFLVIVALFAFNFNKLTGFTAADEKDDYAPTINLYKTDVYGTKVKAGTINAGKIIDVEIKINKGCVDPGLDVYQVRENRAGDKIFGTLEKGPIEYNPGIDECARPSTKGAKIHCSGYKYCQDDLVNDLIKKSFDTNFEGGPGNYIIRVYYYVKPGDNRKDYHIDSEEFKVIF